MFDWSMISTSGVVALIPKPSPSRNFKINKAFCIWYPDLVAQIWILTSDVTSSFNFTVIFSLITFSFTVMSYELATSNSSSTWIHRNTGPPHPLIHWCWSPPHMPQIKFHPAYHSGGKTNSDLSALSHTKLSVIYKFSLEFPDSWLVAERTHPNWWNYVGKKFWCWKNQLVIGVSPQLSAPHKVIQMCQDSWHPWVFYALQQ